MKVLLQVMFISIWSTIIRVATCPLFREGISSELEAEYTLFFQEPARVSLKWFFGLTLIKSLDKFKRIECFS